jgi:hypothetical protein
MLYGYIKMHRQQDIRKGVTSPGKFNSVFIIVYLHLHEQIFITRICTEGCNVTNLKLPHALYLGVFFFCDSLKNGLFAYAVLTD